MPERDCFSSVDIKPLSRSAKRRIKKEQQQITRDAFARIFWEAATNGDLFLLTQQEIERSQTPDPEIYFRRVR